MQWNARLEKIYNDPDIPVCQRFCTWLDRKTNGNLSHCAVSCLPQVDPDDPAPVKLTQADAVKEMNVSPAAISGAVRWAREHGLLLPDTDGYLYTNHCIEGDLFEAALSQSTVLSPLESSRSSGSENLLSFCEYRLQWLAAHPEAARREAALRQQREELKERARDLSDEIKGIGREILAGWKIHLRKTARAASSDSTNGAEPAMAAANSDSGGGADFVNKEPAPASATDVDSANEEFTTPHTPTEANSSTINETGPISPNGEEPLRRRDVGSATAGHDDDPNPPARPEQNGAEDAATPKQPSLTAAIFHGELAAAFRKGGKPVPTRGQSDPCYADLGDQADVFLKWFCGDRRKLAAVQHPGVLPALVDEFRTWRDAEPAPAAPYECCPRCGSETVQSQLDSEEFVARCGRCSFWWRGEIHRGSQSQKQRRLRY